MSISSVQTPWTAARQVFLSIIKSQSFLKLISIESVMSSNHCIHCLPLLLLPSVFPSIRVFSSESVLYIRWPKHFSLNLSISPSNEYSGLIFFRVDWLDLLAVQGTLESSPTTQSKSIHSLVLSFSSKKQVSFNVMDAVTICSESVTVPTLSPSMCHEVKGSDAIILVF